MAKDNRHLHRTAYQAVQADGIEDFDTFQAALLFLKPTSEFVASLFDGQSLKPYEIPAPKEDSSEPDLTKATIEEAAAGFDKTVTKKRQAMSLLMADRWSTFEIRDAIKASEALISQARRELQHMHAAGLIPDLPRCVTDAASIAKKGKPRPDQCGVNHPSNKNASAGWRGMTHAKRRAHKPKKVPGGF